MFQNVILVGGAVVPAGLSFRFNLKMFKLKKVNPRIPAMLLNVLTCIFMTQFVVVVNDFALLKGWVFCDFVIAAAVWIIYICGKHLKTKK